MKLAALLLASIAYAQPTQLSLTASPPPSVTSGGGNAIGAIGQTPVYYWVIARYAAGTAVPLGPIQVNNTVGIANFTSSNYVILNWTGMAGATGYDVLRASTSAYPASPTCASCAVVVNTTSTNFTDQGGATFAYPNGAPGPAPSATASFSIDNRDLNQPFIRVVTNYGGTTNVGAWIQYVLAAPSGSCSNGAFPLRYVIGSSQVYACASGTWTLISGGSSVDCGSTGILVQTAANTYVCRTITAGFGVVVINGDGVSGNPTPAADTDAMLSRATDQAGTDTYCRSTTGNDTYVCALTPTLTAYTRGGCLTLDADTANTLTATINVDTLGAKSILNRAGSALASGDITANKPIQICYDGTQYIIQGDGGGVTSLFDTYTAVAATTCNSSNSGQIALLTASNYSSARCNGTSWEYVVAGFGMKASVPDPANYTLVTSITGTKDTSTGGGIYYHQDTTAGGGGNYVYGALLKAVPSTPYTITGHMRQIIQTATTAFNFFGCGLAWTNGTTTAAKIHIAFMLGTGYSAGKPAVAVRHADSFADASGAWDVDGTTYPAWGTTMLEWFQLADTGSTKTIKISANGVDWKTVYSASSSTNFTPTHYGPACYQGDQPATWQVNIDSISEQ